MGQCLSCCGGSGPDSAAYRQGSRMRPDTEADRAARAAAASAAAQRQQAYENSAVGKAALKSVKAAKPDQRYRDRPNASNDNAKDWLN